MSLPKESLVALLGQHPVFAGLGPTHWAQICGEAIEIHLDDQEILYTSGDRAELLYVLLSGALQIEYPLEGSKRGKVSAILLAPAFIGECQVLNERAWSGTGVAVTELIALGLKKSRFLAMTAEHPALTRALYFELTARFLLAIETWRHQPTNKPEVQLARYFLARQAVLQSLGRPDRTLVVRQVDVASALGIRAETVNRILSRWSKERLVLKEDAGLTLLEPSRLRAIAEASPTPPLMQLCHIPRLD